MVFILQINSFDTYPIVLFRVLFCCLVFRTQHGSYWRWKVSLRAADPENLRSEVEKNEERGGGGRITEKTTKFKERKLWLAATDKEGGTAERVIILPKMWCKNLKASMVLMCKHSPLLFCSPFYEHLATVGSQDWSQNCLLPLFYHHLSFLPF